MPETAERPHILDVAGSQADLMNAANSLDVPDMDDSVFWGPVDDSFKIFMEMDWNLMGSDAEVMHWAL